MGRVAVFLALMLLAGGAADAADLARSDGNPALALAALVGEQSPGLGEREKSVLTKFLAGHADIAARSGTIRVRADSISCRLGNVDIATHRCTLSFGARTVRLDGRAGQLLLATLAENGVDGDGTAGSAFYMLTNLDCSVDAAAVQARDGGGAHCTWSVAP